MQNRGVPFPSEHITTYTHPDAPPFVWKEVQFQSKAKPVSCKHRWLLNRQGQNLIYCAAEFVSSAELFMPPESPLPHMQNIYIYSPRAKQCKSLGLFSMMLYIPTTAICNQFGILLCKAVIIHCHPDLWV